MKLIDREPTQEMLRAMGAVFRDGPRSMTALFQAAYDAAPEIQQKPIAHVYRNEYGTIRIDQQYLPSEGSFPVYAIPPDAQAEIAKRDERIKELEFFQAQHIEKIDELDQANEHHRAESADAGSTKSSRHNSVHVA